MSHVDRDKCHEWMRAECAAYDLARQAREDGMIGTITQISSAALLAIPGLLFGSNQAFPPIVEKPLLYVGIFLFLSSLTLALVEQFLSGKAYRLQAEIAQKYYTFESDKRDATALVPWVRRTRNAACIAFGVAIIVTAASLMTLERTKDGRSGSSVATSATPATTAASSATSAAAANAKLHAGRRWIQEVRSESASASTAEAVTGLSREN